MGWPVHQLLHFGGMDDGSGAWYLWWSGFFANATIFAGVLVVVRHHQCHVKSCWRPGLHEVAGTPYRTCKTHHPAIDETERVTAATIAQAHQDAA